MWAPGGDGTAGSPLVACYLTGKELRALLEVDATVSAWMPEAQLYLSGLEYTFNVRRVPFNKVTQAVLPQTGEGPESGQLYRVVTSLYCAQMLSAVEGRSFGLLSIVPKDESGAPVADLESRILYDRSGRELKEWYALAAYLQTFGGDGIPTSYAWPDGRKEVSRSWNPIELIKSPSLLTVGVLLAAAGLAAAAAALVRALIRRGGAGGTADTAGEDFSYPRAASSPRSDNIEEKDGGGTEGSRSGLLRNPKNFGPVRRRKRETAVSNREQEGADTGDQPDLGPRAAGGRQGEGRAVHHSAGG